MRFAKEGRLFERTGINVEALRIRVGADAPVFCQPGSLVSARGVRIGTCADTRRRSGLSGRLVSMGKRLLAGEGMFLLSFEGEGEILVSGGTPGRVVALDVTPEHPVLGQRDAFLAAIGEVEISPAFQRKLSAALFGGTGLVVQRISGKGTVFFHAGGDFVTVDLPEDGHVLVDPGCAFLWDASVSYEVVTIRDVKTVIFGGEGLFLAKLTGPGTVVIQTAPLSKLRGVLNPEVNK